MPYFVTKRRFWSIAKGTGELFYLEGPRGSEGRYSGQQIYGGEDEVKRVYDAQIRSHRAKGFELVDAKPLPPRGTKGVRYVLDGEESSFEVVKVTSTEAVLRTGPVGSATEWTQHARDWKTLQGRLENHIAHWIAQGYRRVAGKPAPPATSKPRTAAKRRRVPRLKGIVAAFAHAEAWLTANGGAAIVKNLARPATDTALSRAEKRLGFPIPDPMKQLWKVHDGQKTEGSPFVHERDLLSVAQAVRLRDDFVTSIQFIIDEKDGDELKPAERNDRWLPFAAQDSDMYAVHATTGRVFDFCEALDLELEKNLTKWFESYAQAIEQGEYVVTEGFGGVYLSS